MPVNKPQMAQFTNYSLTNDPSTGELVITARFQGKDVNQRLMVQPPCVLFFDPIGGFYAVSVPGMTDTWQFADVVLSIT